MIKGEITFDRFVRGLIFVASVVLAIWAVRYLSGVLLPFVVAWFVAYLLYPLVSFVQYRLRLRYRVPSILVSLVLVCAVGWGLVAVSMPSIVRETQQFEAAAQKFVQNGIQNHSLPQDFNAYLSEQVKRLDLDSMMSRDDLVQMVREVAPKVWNLIYETAGVLITVVSSLIALIYLFFLLIDYEKLHDGFLRLVPHRRRRMVADVMDDIARSMNSYFRGQALISLCVGLLFCIGFLLIDFPLAIPLGVLIGLLSLVPYLHSLGLIPILILSLMKAADTGQNFWVILVVALAVFLVVQVIQDLVLTPRIMGRAMCLPPYVILLSLSVWGYMLGVIGMIIALPLTTLALSYYRRYVVGGDGVANGCGADEQDVVQQ